MNEIQKKQLLEEIIDNRFSDPQKALECSLRLYDESIKGYDYYYASIAKFYEGDAFLSLDDLTKSCEHLLEAVSLQKTHGYSDYLGKCYNVLGAVFYSQCDYILAMKYFLNALESAIELKDYYTQALINNNIAAVFLVFDDFLHSRQFFMKAIHGMNNSKIITERDFFITHRLKMNLGICYAAEGKIMEAKKSMDAVLAEINHKKIDYSVMYLEEMGIFIYKKSGEIDKALDYALRMVKDAKKNCNSETILVTYSCIHFLIEQEHYKEAKDLLHTVENVSKKNESLPNQISILQEWIFYYKQLNDKEKYHQFYKKYYELIQNNKSYYLQNQISALENRNLLTKMMDANKELLEQKNEYEQKTSIDSLTGLLNRKGMKQLVDTLLIKSKKYQNIINLAIIDIDHFKTFNDNYGHLVGDQCIKEVSKIIHTMESKRIHGVRFGGDEFLLIGSDITEKTWENVIRKIQSSLKEKEIITKKQKHVSITTSIGVYSCIPSQTMEFHDYIHCADFALYEVKRKGRNHYLVYDKHFDEKEEKHEL